LNKHLLDDKGGVIIYYFMLMDHNPKPFLIKLLFLQSQVWWSVKTDEKESIFKNMDLFLVQYYVAVLN
jgi:hypothetical protein